MMAQGNQQKRDHPKHTKLPSFTELTASFDAFKFNPRTEPPKTGDESEGDYDVSPLKIESSERSLSSGPASTVGSSYGSNSYFPPPPSSEVPQFHSTTPFLAAHRHSISVGSNMHDSRFLNYTFPPRPSVQQQHQQHPSRQLLPVSHQNHQQQYQQPLPPPPPPHYGPPHPNVVPHHHRLSIANRPPSFSTESINTVETMKRSQSLSNNSLASISSPNKRPPASGNYTVLPRHSRQVSTPSNGSLNALAQVSSSMVAKGNNNDANHTSLLHDIENFIYSTETLANVVNEIKNDLIRHIAGNTELLNTPESELIRLLFHYSKDNTNLLQGSKILKESLKNFLWNIPMDVLENCIGYSEKAASVLHEWRIMRIEEDRKIQLREQNKSKAKAPQKRRKSSEENYTKRKRDSINLKVNPTMGEALLSVSGPGTSSSTSARTSTSTNTSVNTGTNTGTNAGTNTGSGTSSNTLRHEIEPPLAGGLNEDLSPKKKLVCLQCDETDTPEWRRGPYGSRTLCNACGLFHSKLVKKMGVRAAAELMLERRRAGQGTDRKVPSEDEE
ncbi:hypothetical protein PACTADRAFT_35886 [Pachysolen tannophilus NRRL Y-2460]|uniref:GATA-type domain-containing protein n=1 Tax=Pachysolen tannophilus NRRL Y-2460 TaxID=669874 RepID=A0A1E4TNA9_PACTA|nr:hypothetical protein PACTADRAFT_35886 [Pachysolen tannophilus NRRL Y-2460]